MAHSWPERQEDDRRSHAACRAFERETALQMKAFVTVRRRPWLSLTRPVTPEVAGSSPVAPVSRSTCNKRRSNRGGSSAVSSTAAFTPRDAVTSATRSIPMVSRTATASAMERKVVAALRPITGAGASRVVRDHSGVRLECGDLVPDDARIDDVSRSVRTGRPARHRRTGTRRSAFHRCSSPCRVPGGGAWGSRADDTARRLGVWGAKNRVPRASSVRSSRNRDGRPSNMCLVKRSRRMRILQVVFGRPGTYPKTLVGAITKVPESGASRACARDARSRGNVLVYGTRPTRRTKVLDGSPPNGCDQNGRKSLPSVSIPT